MGGPDSASPHNSERRKKRRPVAYPRLHEALFVWMEAIEKEVTITGAILKAKAADQFPRCTICLCGHGRRFRPLRQFSPS